MMSVFIFRWMPSLSHHESLSGRAKATELQVLHKVVDNATTAISAAALYAAGSDSMAYASSLRSHVDEKTEQFSRHMLCSDFLVRLLRPEVTMRRVHGVNEDTNSAQR